MSTINRPGTLRLLRRNALLIYGTYAAAIVSGLLVTPIVLDSLGTEAYGVWSFIGAITIFLSLLDFGVAPSIIRFGAEYRGRRDREAMDALASVGLALYGAIGLITAAIGIALVWFVPTAVSAPDELVWPTRVATLLVVVGIASRFPLGLVSNLLLAHQRFDIVNLGSIVSIVLYSVLVATLLTWRGGLVLLAALALVATLVRLVFPLPWFRRELPDLRLSRALITAEKLRRLTSFSFDNFLIHLAGKVVFSADLIVVGLLLGAMATGLYAVPAKLFALAAAIAMAATNVLLPALSELEGTEQESRQRALFLTGLRASMGLALVVALPFVFIPDLLLSAWVGWELDEPAWVLGLLGVALILHQPVHVVGLYLIARGRQRTLSRALLAVVAANVILSIVFAKVVGLWGVAASTLLTEAVAVGIVAPLLVARASGLSRRALAAASLRPLIPALLVAIPVFVGLARSYDVDTLLDVALLGTLWVVASCVAIWRFGFGPTERSALARKILPERPWTGVAPGGDELPG